MQTLAASRPAVKASTPPRLVEIRGLFYGVAPVASNCPDVIAAVRLTKLTDGTTYDLAASDFAGLSCDCPDFEFRHRDAGTCCKHLRAVIAAGLFAAAEVALDPEGRVVGVRRAPAPLVAGVDRPRDEFDPPADDRPTVAEVLADSFPEPEPTAADLLVNESRLLAESDERCVRLARKVDALVAERDTLIQLARDLATQLETAERGEGLAVADAHDVLLRLEATRAERDALRAEVEALRGLAPADFPGHEQDDELKRMTTPPTGGVPGRRGPLRRLRPPGPAGRGRPGRPGLARRPPLRPPGAGRGRGCPVSFRILDGTEGFDATDMPGAGPLPARTRTFKLGVGREVVTAIVRDWHEGDEGRCRRCDECTADGGQCIKLVDLDVPGVQAPTFNACGLRIDRSFQSRPPARRR